MPSKTYPEPEWDHKNQYYVIKRNRQLSHFDADKIAAAMNKAFLAVEGETATASNRIQNVIQSLTTQVINAISRHLRDEGTVPIEDIQDQVELALMRAGFHKIARAYVLYREEHAHLRSEQAEETITYITDKQGNRHPLDENSLKAEIKRACTGLEDVNPELITTETLKNIFDGISETDLNHSMILCTRTLIEKEPNYTYVAARLLLNRLRLEALDFVGFTYTSTDSNYYLEYFKLYIEAGIKKKLLTPELRNFDLDKLGKAIIAERDTEFTYLGLQTLYDRYFLHWDSVRLEMPQAFFMRVSMGLCLHEENREERAIEFYNLFSNLDFMSSTPTLFNSGTLRPQLSSCFLSTVPDDLSGIYDALKDNALLSKYAGGLGNDWTPVRGMGAHIKGTNGKSQGVVPFLKVANDTLVACNQCFAPNTKVFTSEGVKNIQEIQIGDLVVGKDGNHNKVINTFEYTQNIGNMVEVDVKHSIFPVKTTSNHPFFVVQPRQKNLGLTRTLKDLNAGKNQPSWTEAGKLNEGDFVAQIIPTKITSVEGFTEDDARLYGIILGDGHCSKREFDNAFGDSTQGIKFEWGVAGNPKTDTHLEFVRNYLSQRNIHYWETSSGDTYVQIRWSNSSGVSRDNSNGKFISGEPVLPFDFDDIYTQEKQKYISPRFSHLPKNQTLRLLQGLIETDGCISRGKEIIFTNTSYQLIEGFRYQSLRLGVPTSGQYREHEQEHTGTRSDGTKVSFSGTCKSYVLRVPAIPSLANLLNCQELTKYNWFEWEGCVFSRIESVQDVASSNVIYDLQVENEPSYMTTSALVHNSGKRRGSGCAYLETWHIDIEEFLELRKNTGDDRRRTHDMNTANWIPDEFMVRVHENKNWTLISPDEAPELHDLYGKAFSEKYEEYEAKAQRGELKIWKQVSAVELWRKMLTMLFETGHPWLTFKDPCNLRNPQQHEGVVHSSNLCCEITLNTKAGKEIGVCNLSSINLVNHIKDAKLDTEKLEKTIKIAMRALDNVIEVNYYAIDSGRESNLRHRPVGLGIMGFQDALYKLGIPYASQEAVEFADTTQELISYYAISASCELAEERGAYASFKGSLWQQGILPIDSIEKLAQARGEYLEMSTKSSLDWNSLRERVKKVGMRNSNTMAIAPTATISNICGVSQSIEPTYQNLFVKSNLSGEFTMINPYLVKDLKALDLWDEVMLNDLKFYDGRLKAIDRIPDNLKELYATAFEIDSTWLVEAASRRQKWIDQAQSLNLYILEPSGRKLDSLYKLAWKRGLKTTYYMRAMGATHVAKSTITTNYNTSPQVCNIDDETCEACQ